MNRILTIAGLTIRGAVRSRVVLTLVLFLLLVIFCLPVTIRGDGTIAGHVQIVLNYTLGLAGLLLAVVSIWLGCAGVSNEIQQRQIQLVVTKPVHAAEIWFGKWLGILCINGCLLLFAGAVTFGLLKWTTRPAVLDEPEQAKLESEILVARREVMPEPLDIDTRARKMFEDQVAAGLIPDGMSVDEALTSIRDAMAKQAYAIPAGYARKWVLNLPRMPAADQPLFIQFKFSSSDEQGLPVAGIWNAGPGDGVRVFEERGQWTPGGVYAIRLPAEAVGADGGLEVEFANANRASVTVLFAPDDGLKALVYEGGFEMNFLRALILMFIQLAFFAAVGLAAGSCFSLPVAAFTSAWVVLLLGLSRYLESMAAKTIYFSKHGQAITGPTLLDRFFHGVFRLLSAVVQPLRGPNPLELLSVGELVSWTLVITTFVAKVVLYAGLLAWFSALVLSRREIALPVQ